MDKLKFWESPLVHRKLFFHGFSCCVVMVVCCECTTKNAPRPANCEKRSSVSEDVYAVVRQAAWLTWRQLPVRRVAMEPPSRRNPLMSAPTGEDHRFHWCTLYRLSMNCRNSAWIDVHYDPVASLYTFSSCMGKW